MFKLEIHKKAIQTLDFLKLKDKNTLKKIIDSLDEITLNWIKNSSIKNIWDWIFRRRIWRYRILLTFDNKQKHVIHIWIIDLEKDTKKDYKKWKTYIIKYIIT